MSTSVNEARTMAMLNVTAEIVKSNPDAKIYDVTRSVYKLAALAKALHKRYENMCNYAWATTDKYEKRTDKMETLACDIGSEIGLTVALQRDPRGWPIVCTIGGYVTRLG